MMRIYNAILELLNVRIEDFEDIANSLYEIRNDLFVYATKNKIYVELSMCESDAILDIRKAGFDYIRLY